MVFNVSFLPSVSQDLASVPEVEKKAIMENILKLKTMPCHEQCYINPNLDFQTCYIECNGNNVVTYIIKEKEKSVVITAIENLDFNDSNDPKKRIDKWREKANLEMAVFQKLLSN